MTECTVSDRLNYMSTIVSATVARNNFFDILNRVLYGNEVIYITKAGTKARAKMSKYPATNKILDNLSEKILSKRKSDRVK